MSQYNLGFISGKTATTIGRTFRGIGNVLGGVGIGTTFYQMGTGKIGAREGATDLGFGVLGFVSVPGMVFSTVYFVDKELSNQFPEYVDFKSQARKSNEISTRTIMQNNSGWWHNPVCFAAGTKVSTSKDLISIEDVSIGDTVLTYNLDKRAVEYGNVSKVFSHSVKEIYIVEFGGVSVSVTGEHPFYVKNKGWVKVNDLKTSNVLVNSDGDEIEIDSIKMTNKKTEVYNIRVNGNHNYFVTKRKVLVHNK